MKIVDDVPSPLTALDRPNSYIGRSVPRPNLKRLAQGRAQYVSDMVLPRMGHVAYLRSPFAHARIRKIDKSKAEKAPGVIAVVTGPELAKVITPWVGVLTHLKGIKSAPQNALAIDRACWQGEAVCAVVAQSRALAEDACELIEIDYEELTPVTDPETALDPKTPVIHPELGDNLTFERTLDVGEVDKAAKESDAVVEQTFIFGRHTGVCNEGRAILADWNPGDERLTVYHATQAPHMMQNLFAKHLDLAEHQVRVVTKDVGGSFGIKVHTYADEMAVVALSKMLKRPIKFVADRLESFVTDIHARDHRVKGRIGINKDGTITFFEIDDLTGIGPYSVYPRTSRHRGQPGGEPHRRALCLPELSRPRPRGVPEQERDVPVPRGRPSDRDRGDRRAGRSRRGEDRHGPGRGAQEKPLSRTMPIRRTAASGIKFEKLSHIASTDKILKMMDYKALRADQAAARAKGIHRGIGFASFIEVTNPSAAFYGVGGAKISAQDGATVRLDGQGAIFCHTGVSEQGQGAEAVIAQCVASAFGVSMDKVRVIMGDTDNTPYGGGTWASRAAGIGGEAAWQAGKALRENVLAAAASILQAKAGDLDINDSIVVDKGTKTERISLERSRAHLLFPARHAAARLPGRTGGDAPLCAARLGVLLHQRHPGVVSRGRHRYRLHQAAEALVRGGLRHRDQSAARRRAGARRHRAGPRRRAVRALPL